MSYAVNNSSSETLICSRERAADLPQSYQALQNEVLNHYQNPGNYQLLAQGRAEIATGYHFVYMHRNATAMSGVVTMGNHNEMLWAEEFNLDEKSNS